MNDCLFVFELHLETVIKEKPIYGIRIATFLKLNIFNVIASNYLRMPEWTDPSLMQLYHYSFSRIMVMQHPDLTSSD